MTTKNHGGKTMPWLPSPSHHHVFFGGYGYHESHAPRWYQTLHCQVPHMCKSRTKPQWLAMGVFVLWMWEGIIYIYMIVLDSYISLFESSVPQYPVINHYDAYVLKGNLGGVYLIFRHIHIIFYYMIIWYNVYIYIFICMYIDI